jgi:hypothetical protein
MELIETIDDIEEETQELIKGELKKVFGKHIEDIIDDMLKENLGNLMKALDISDEQGEEELIPITKILQDIREYQWKGKTEVKQEEWRNIGIRILQVIVIDM